jgi:hypothetical protein
LRLRDGGLRRLIESHGLQMAAGAWYIEAAGARGPGCGAPCDFCRVIVDCEEIEYEVEARVGTETLLLHFHPRCYDTWRASCEGHAPAPPAGK